MSGDARLRFNAESMIAATVTPGGISAVMPDVTAGLNPFDAAHALAGPQHAAVHAASVAAIEAHAAGLATAGLVTVDTMTVTETINARGLGGLW